MGNADSKLEIDQSVHNDVEKGNLLAFSFGPELEMVLVPDRQKILDFLHAVGDTETLQVFTSLPSVDELAKKGVVHKKDHLCYELRPKWAKIVTSILTHSFEAGPTTMQCIYAHDPTAPKLKHEGTYYRRWSVIEDPAIDFNAALDEWSVEVVSKVQYSYKGNWRREFELVLTILSSYFRIETGQRGSTHVHVKQVPYDRKHASEINLAFARALAKFAVFWDPCLYLLGPKRRRVREHCVSNLRSSMHLHKFMQSSIGLEYRVIFAGIDGDWYNLGDIKEKDKVEEAKLVLVRLMCASYKHHAWNFLYLTTGKSDLSEEGAALVKCSGTIEYRRGHGSRDVGELKYQSALAQVFAHAAVRHVVENTLLYQEMCATKIVFTQKAWVSTSRDEANPELYPECVQFGADHFAQFVNWMKEEASRMNLLDLLGPYLEINTEKETTGEDS